MSADDLAREIGRLARRVEQLERVSRTPSAAPSSGAASALAQQVRSLSGSAPQVIGEVLAGSIPEGSAIGVATGSGVWLTNEFGQFVIETPFTNALVSLVAATGHTDAFGGTVGIYSRSNVGAAGNFAPIMRCVVGGTPTAQVYVQADWIAYGC